ncbi:hypothetical protein D3C71_1877610 [compost metagenome]
MPKIKLLKETVPNYYRNIKSSMTSRSVKPIRMSVADIIIHGMNYMPVPYMIITMEINYLAIIIYWITMAMG